MIDMHLHTKWSDGNLTVPELVTRLKDEGITHAVLTDHDCILGYNEFLKECNKNEIKTIPGVELEAYYDLDKSLYLHILCYAYKNHKKINEFLEYERELRIKAIKKGIYLFAQKGVNIDFDDVKNMSTGRHLLINHLCILLEKKSIFTSRYEAYNAFMNPNSEFYVDYPKITVEKIIDLIYRVGGIPVLAHPKRIRMTDFEKEKYISYLKEKGLQGIESFYSFDTKEERIFSIQMALKYDLIQTIGSDWHCPEDNISFGNKYASEENILKLKRRFFNE